MNLKVKLLLQMISNLSGAKDARRELRGIKGEADRLKSATAGDRLSRDIKKIGADAQRAKRDILALGSAAKATGAAGLGAAGRARDRRGRFTGAGGDSGGGATGSGATALIPGGRGAIGAIGGYYAARAGVRGTVGQSVAFEKAMADVKKKLDLSDGDTWANVEGQINSVAQRLGRSRTEAASLAAELGAAGTSSRDLSSMMELTARAAVAWDMTLGEAGEKMMKIKTQHQLTNREMEDFGDMVNALADSGASKERDVVEMFQRAAAGAKAANVDRNTSLAFMTGMNAAGMQEEVAARAFAAMTQKLRTAKSSGGKNMKEGLGLLGMTPDQVEKGMKADAQKMLLKVMEAFNKTPDKAAAGVKMFGEGWWDEFARMAQAGPEIEKNLKLLGDPSKWKGSMQKSLNIELETTANHLERLKALASDVGDRLGKWALPPINAAIEGIIAKLNELDAAKDKRKRDAEIARKVGAGEQLSPDERAAIAGDDALRRAAENARVAAEQVEDFNRTMAIEPALSREDAVHELDKAKGRNLDRAIALLQRELDDTDPTGRLRSGDRRRLDQMKAQRAQLPTGERTEASPRARPADQDDREARVGDVELMRRAVEVLDQRLKSLQSLAQLYPGTDAPERQAQAAEISALRAKRDARMGQMTDSIPFNFGTGAKSMPDLAPAGGLIMQSLMRGMESGGAGAGALAEGVRDKVESPFRGMDLQAEGQRAMESLAQGIRAGEGSAVAAATAAKARILGALGGGAGVSGRVSGALHDGATGQ